MVDANFPQQYSRLEPLADWSLATQHERERKRAGSTAVELGRIYETLLPCLESILEYLNQFPLDGMPADVRRLFYLTLSFAEIAPFVECYGGEPRVPNSFDDTRFVAVHGDRVG